MCAIIKGFFTLKIKDLNIQKSPPIIQLMSDGNGDPQEGVIENQESIWI